MPALHKLVAAGEQLESLLQKSLTALGDHTPEDNAKRFTHQLFDLYIRTPDQLHEGLNSLDVIEEVRRVLPGRLLHAVRSELRSKNAEAEWKKAMPLARSLVKEQHWTPPPKLLRRFEVVRVDMTQLSAINQITQTFRARVFIILKITGGARDEHLLKEFDGFPLDAKGKPTFRPSARWYLSQFDFVNGRDLREIESKVTVAGDDLQLIKRVDGEFFERFELNSFPFDAQDLTVTLSVNCATAGPVPVEFFVPPGAHMGVDVSNFAFADVWDLSPVLSGEAATVGATASRRFPALHVHACVSRRSFFVLFNVAMPMGALSLISASTFVIDYSETGAQLEISLTVLLTAIAFKFVIAAYLPQISYLTLIDKYLFACTAIIYLATLLASLGGALHNWGSDSAADSPTDALNGTTAGHTPGHTGADQRAEDGLQQLQVVFFTLIILCWVVLQSWFTVAAFKARKEGTERGVDRASEQLRRAGTSSSLNMEAGPEASKFQPMAGRPKQGLFRHKQSGASMLKGVSVRFTETQPPPNAPPPSRGIVSSTAQPQPPQPPQQAVQPRYGQGTQFGVPPPPPRPPSVPLEPHADRGEAEEEPSPAPQAGIDAPLASADGLPPPPLPTPTVSRQASIGGEREAHGAVAPSTALAEERTRSVGQSPAQQGGSPSSRGATPTFFDDMLDSDGLVDERDRPEGADGEAGHAEPRGILQ
jgi:hypothetical protein